MNRQPYPTPYGMHYAIQGPPPPKVSARPMYYGEPQQGFYQPVAMYPAATPPVGYAPPGMYPAQTPPPYPYSPYQKQGMYPEQPPMYIQPVGQTPQTEYIAYQDVPHPAHLYQRPQQQPMQPMPPAPPIQPVPPVKKKEKPQPVYQQPTPPVREVPKQSEDIRLQIPNKPLFSSDAPPGEFDFMTRGTLPSIVFTSEVSIKPN